MTENEAIKKLEYTRRNCGMPYQGDTWKPNAETIALDIAIKALEEVQQYRSIGTVDECRELVERCKPKKVRISHDGAVQDRGKAYCPNCGLDIHGKGKIGACFRCSQAISWECDEE